MIQYFQLTPDILLEYVYESDPKLNEDNIKGNIKDIIDEDYQTILLKSNAFGSKYLCFKNDSEGLDSFSNIVLPLNTSETQFVIAKSKYQNFFSGINVSNKFLTKDGSGNIYEDTKYDNDILENSGSCDVAYDKCILHFTSRNYFGSYDALIFQAYVYMTDKSKLYLASFLFKRTSNLELKSEHMLYNEKLYTTHIEFDIPSVCAIFEEYISMSPENSEIFYTNSSKTSSLFVDALRQQNIELLKNTPICINVYGVTGSILGTDNYERLKTYKINSIYIPYIYNRLSNISIDIKEEDNADYYTINPKINGYPSFVEYIESIGEDIRSYIIMHELCLKEHWFDNDSNTFNSIITHREQHIININEDDEDEEIERRFDAKIKYRPICMYSEFSCSADIIDTIKIINTVDNSTYEVTGSAWIDNPKKYGKSLRALDTDLMSKLASRPIVNVYNKKVSDKTQSGNVSGNNKPIDLSRGGGFVVENLSQNITSFIECTNIGVSVVDLSPEEIN